jgi:hypothetical protein
MSSPLVGVFAKINRAEEHLGDFKSHWKAGVGSPVNYILTESYYEGGHIHFPAYVVAPSPMQSVWIGEILHDTRSALDHLAHQLIFKHPDRIATMKAQIKGGEKAFNRLIQFPIFDDPDNFGCNHKVKGLKALLDAKEFTAVETAQPYKRQPTDPTKDWMHVLSTLNNIDKHRTILMIDKRILWKGGAEGFEYESISSVTETGTDLFSIPVDDPNAEVNMENITEFIQFTGTGTVADGESVVMFTRDLIRRTRDLVNNDFVKLFF